MNVLLGARNSREEGKLGDRLHCGWDPAPQGATWRAAWPPAGALSPQVGFLPKVQGGETGGAAVSTYLLCSSLPHGDVDEGGLAFLSGVTLALSDLSKPDTVVHGVLFYSWPKCMR